MTKQKTLYQDKDTEEVIFEIDDILAYLAGGMKVSDRQTSKQETIYEVTGVEDVVKSYDEIHRTIWCKKVASYTFGF